jgi:anti-sigma factor RsiW
MPALSCQRFADLLGDYTEGVLPFDERAAMDAHALACPSCSALRADYQRVPGVVRKATDVEMPSGAKGRLRRALTRAWRRRR